MSSRNEFKKKKKKAIPLTARGGLSSQSRVAVAVAGVS
jgi:hypothetical protein